MNKTIISLTVLFAVASLSACASTSNPTDENYKKLGHANHLNILRFKLLRLAPN